MKYTCVECLFHYDNLSGDVEERMCYECLNEDVNTDPLPLSSDGTGKTGSTIKYKGDG